MAKILSREEMWQLREIELVEELKTTRTERDRAEDERNHYKKALERMAVRERPDGLAVHALATVQSCYRRKAA